MSGHPTTFAVTKLFRDCLRLADYVASTQVRLENGLGRKLAETIFQCSLALAGSRRETSKMRCGQVPLLTFYRSLECGSR